MFNSIRTVCLTGCKVRGVNKVNHEVCNTKRIFIVHVPYKKRPNLCTVFIFRYIIVFIIFYNHLLYPIYNTKHYCFGDLLRFFSDVLCCVQNYFLGLSISCKCIQHENKHNSNRLMSSLLTLLIRTKV